MEAEEDRPPPYTAVSNSDSYNVENENQSNNAREAVLLQQNAQSCAGVSSNGVVLIQSPTVLINPRVKGNSLIWRSVVVSLCCWGCTGFIAYKFARKAHSEYKAGNIVQWEKNQNFARRWMIVSVFASVLIWIPFMIVFFVLILPELIN